jgi:hypothetical protein
LIIAPDLEAVTLKAIATKAVFTAEQYLQTSFDGPDREFVDGEVVERNEGEKPHSKAQVRLVEMFYELRRKHPIHTAIDLRMQLIAVALSHPRLRRLLPGRAD